MYWVFLFVLYYQLSKCQLLTGLVCHVESIQTNLKLLASYGIGWSRMSKQVSYWVWSWPPSYTYISKFLHAAPARLITAI
jgi:lipoprotein signal peptidase